MITTNFDPIDYRLTGPDIPYRDLRVGMYILVFSCVHVVVDVGYNHVTVCDIGLTEEPNMIKENPYVRQSFCLVTPRYADDTDI